MRWDTWTDPLPSSAVGQVLTLKATPGADTQVDCPSLRTFIEGSEQALPEGQRSCTPQIVSHSLTITKAMVGKKLHLSGASYIPNVSTPRTQFSTNITQKLGERSGSTTITAAKPADAKITATAPLVTKALDSVGMLAFNTQVDVSQSARYSLVIMQGFNQRFVPEVKKNNPATKAYLYQNAGAASEGATEATGQPNIVSSLVVRQHPSWLVHGQDEATMHWGDYTYLHPIDLGDPELQTEAIRKVSEDVLLGSWDGVFYDDVNQNYASHDYRSDATGEATTPKDYEGGSLYAATSSFVHRVPKQVSALTGKPSMMNVQQNWQEQDWLPALRDWSEHSGGIMLEHAASWGEGERVRTPEELFNTLDIQWRLNEMHKIYQHGSAPMLVTYMHPQDYRLQRYHRALFLLGWNGREGLSLVRDDVSAATLPNTFLGSPQGDYVKQGELYARRYGSGYVILNSGLSEKTVSPATLGVGTSTIPVRVPARDAVLGR